MTYTELQDFPTMDLKTLLQFPSVDTPLFWPLMLFVIYIVFTFLTFFGEVRRTGSGNFLSSLAVAGYIATAMATIMTFLDLIQVQVIVITFAISITFQVLYMLSKRG